MWNKLYLLLNVSMLVNAKYFTVPTFSINYFQSNDLYFYLIDLLQVNVRKVFISTCSVVL